MIDCPYFQPGHGGGGCSIGLYGGQAISAGTHLACIKRGENNPEFAAKLKEIESKAHPETAPKISGCCDAANQS